MKTKTNKLSVETLTYGAILTALVVVLQLMGAFIKFGAFSISLVLVPIVIGAALCGVGMGTWLGLVFGFAVLLSGDAAAFLAIDVPGTIFTVLAKGAGCGLVAGMVYQYAARLNKYVGVMAAAMICPIVNTGIFLLGCRVFFYHTLIEWGANAGYAGNFAGYLLFGFVGVNFLVELAINLFLSPVIVRLLDIAKKIKKS